MCLGITGVITEVRDDDGVPMAVVDTDSAVTVIACLLTYPEARAGMTVLVHSGYVLQILDESAEEPS